MIERERWLQALSLDPETGLDPAGFKVRAAQGLDAAVSRLRDRPYHDTDGSLVGIHSRLLDLAEDRREPCYARLRLEFDGYGSL